MTRPAAETRVNPMVGKKLRTSVLTNLEAISAALHEGNVPVIAPNPENPKDIRAAKFSDIFAYKNFLSTNKLGDVDLKVTGGKNDPLMQRIVTDYLSKGQTPNCSIQQLLAIDGAKITVKHTLTALGQQVVQAGSTEGGGDKPKRVRGKKAEAKPKAEKKAAPAKRARKAKAETVEAEKPRRTRRTREQIEADNAAAAAAPKTGRGRRKAADTATQQGVEVKAPQAPSGAAGAPKTDWD